MGSGRPDLGSDRPDWGSERPILRPRRLFSRLGGGGQMDGRTDGNRKICHMWNHRSSAPPGPLPKKDENLLKDGSKKGTLTEEKGGRMMRRGKPSPRRDLK